LQENANSYSDSDIEVYVKGLGKRESSDLQEELAHLYFDYLFVQTQIETSKIDDVDNLTIVTTGQRRLSRLQSKIEAVKRELFGRLNKTPLPKKELDLK